MSFIPLLVARSSRMELLVYMGLELDAVLQCQVVFCNLSLTMILPGFPFCGTPVAILLCLLACL
jgi:hypothetical protein